MVGQALDAPLRMKIGDLVIYGRKLYVLRGFDPMSVSNRQAELELPSSGVRRWVPLADVRERPPDPPRRGFT